MPRALFFYREMTPPKCAYVLLATARRADVKFYDRVILSGQKAVCQKSSDLNDGELFTGDNDILTDRAMKCFFCHYIAGK